MKGREDGYTVDAPARGRNAVCFIFVIVLVVFIAIAAIVALYDEMKGD